MSRRPIDVHVSREDQKAIREILRAGIQQVRVVLRAIALEQLTAGQTAPVVARIVHLSSQAVRRIAHAISRADWRAPCMSAKGAAPRSCWMPLKSSASSRWCV